MNSEVKAKMESKIKSKIKSGTETYYKNNQSPAQVSYCPFCGEQVYSSYSDGTYQCDDCGRRFGVTEVE